MVCLGACQDKTLCVSLVNWCCCHTSMFLHVCAAYVTYFLILPANVNGATILSILFADVVAERHILAALSNTFSSIFCTDADLG